MEFIGSPKKQNKKNISGTRSVVSQHLTIPVRTALSDCVMDPVSPRKGDVLPSPHLSCLSLNHSYYLEVPSSPLWDALQDNGHIVPSVSSILQLFLESDSPDNQDNYHSLRKGYSSGKSHWILEVSIQLQALGRPAGEPGHVAARCVQSDSM